MEKEKLIYKSEYTGDNEVELDIQTYHNNGRIFIGLITNEDGYPEPFGDVTVNIDAPAPDYCGYLDTNNLSNVENFIRENDWVSLPDLRVGVAIVNILCICSMWISFVSFVLNRWQPMSIVSVSQAKSRKKKKADRSD